MKLRSIIMSLFLFSQLLSSFSYLWVISLICQGGGGGVKILPIQVKVTRWSLLSELLDSIKLSGSSYICTIMFCIALKRLTHVLLISIVSSWSLVIWNISFSSWIVGSGKYSICLKCFKTTFPHFTNRYHGWWLKYNPLWSINVCDCFNLQKWTTQDPHTNMLQ